MASSHPHIHTRNYKLLFTIFSKNNIKRHKLIYLIMSMLYNKIRFEIDLNSDELLKIIWEHMREIKKESWKDIIKLINLHLLIIILIFEEQGNHVIPKNHSCQCTCWILLMMMHGIWILEYQCTFLVNMNVSRI